MSSLRGNAWLVIDKRWAVISVANQELVGAIGAIMLVGVVIVVGWQQRAAVQ